MRRAKMIAAAFVALTAAGATAQVATSAEPHSVAPSTAPEPEPLICRSSIETGSLVKQRKVCLTKKQWHYVTDASSDQARRLVEGNTSRPSGN